MQLHVNLYVFKKTCIYIIPILSSVFPKLINASFCLLNTTDLFSLSFYLLESNMENIFFQKLFCKDSDHRRCQEI